LKFQFLRDKKTLGHVHSSSLMLRLASHHLAVFLRLIVGRNDAPGLSRCSGASGCSGPLLTPCFASCSSLSYQHFFVISSYIGI